MTCQFKIMYVPCHHTYGMCSTIPIKLCTCVRSWCLVVTHCRYIATLGLVHALAAHDTCYAKHITPVLFFHFVTLG